MNQFLKDIQNSLSGIIGAIIVIALVLGLLVWCFIILSPFLDFVIWGAIIAIAVYPVFLKLSQRIGNKMKLAAIIVTLIFLAIIIVPSLILTESLVSKLRELSGGFDPESLNIAPPPAKVAEWPLIGDSVYQFWNTASSSLESLILKYEPQLIKASKWMLTSVVETGFGIKFFRNMF